ncbi:membrane protein [Streptomyces thermoviolaceus subsp. thermoviolaceus]|uniref:DUF1275 domain-containing protein n=1 Tax=Streptomyces thermoviolaceus subsp. thermoviolaceus TaxID=66860 RepID=A0ABX0YRP4_STRTL|nr:YoaK family protein [Streptomyces thermoviolaceus]NJP13801.1 DUF1275 domain-containing protein [Streptomyces thermoviolaceus subsp. thermoviolaceus]GHA80332.1 membrane protein [Streptomyces thermoviolaceus subsp. thermoviolaceus]
MTAHEAAPSPDDDAEARGLRLVPVLLGLTVTSGIIDAVSFLGLQHVFTANMTGNIVILGFAAAGAPGFSVPHTATSLVCFMAGALAGGRVAHRLASCTRRRWARVALAVEAGFVAAASVVAFAVPGAAATPYVLIALTAFAMGLRNATVPKLRVSGLTTTVLTRTLTGLIADSRVGGGPGEHSPRRAASVLAMLAGATLGGALVVRRDVGTALLVAAVVTGGLAAVASGRE